MGSGADTVNKNDAEATKKDKSLLEKAEDLGSDTVSALAHKAENAGSALQALIAEAWQDTGAKKVVEGTKEVISSAANGAYDGAASFLHKLGETASTAENAVVHAVENGAEALAAKIMAQGVDSLAFDAAYVAATLGTPAELSLGLVPVGKDKWQTLDKDLTVERVNFKSDDAIEQGFSDLDKQAKGECPSTSIEIVSPLELVQAGLECKASKEGLKLPEKTGKQTSVQDLVLDTVALFEKSLRHTPQALDGAHDQPGSREYLLDAGVHATIEARPGEVSYKSTARDGSIITSALRLGDIATIEHLGQTATLDIGGKTLRFDSKQVHILQQPGRATISVGEYGTIVRENGMLTLEDKSRHKTTVSQDCLKFDDGISIFATAADLARAIPEPGTTKLRVSGDGREARLLLKDGTQIAVRSDHALIIIFPDGKRFGIDAKGVHRFQDDPNKPQADWDNLETAPVVTAPAADDPKIERRADGTLIIGGLVIDHGKIETDEGSLDAQLMQVKVKSPTAEQAPTVATLHPGEATTIDSPRGHIEVAGTTTVVTAPDGQKTVLRIGLAPEIDTDAVNVGLNEITVKATPNGEPTIISADNTVRFGGKDAPILNGDGSMRLDAYTAVDRDGNVSSGSWHSNAFLAGRNCLPMAGGHAGGCAPLPLDATQAAVAVAASQSAENAASDILRRATSGNITLGEISLLESDAGQLGGFLSQISGAAALEVASALASVMHTIEMARPRAEAAETDRLLTAATPVAQKFR